MKAICIFTALMVLVSCQNSADNKSSLNDNLRVGGFDQSDITFHGMAYDQSKIEPIIIQTASASIYRNSQDGQLKLGFGFSEYSLSSDTCSSKNKYSQNPSDINQKQRIFSVFNLPLIVGTKQSLTNEDFWKDGTSPGGKIYFFDETHKEKNMAVLYPSAFGDVTILKLSDDFVTVHIDQFIGRGKGSLFRMNGTATLKICK